MALEDDVGNLGAALEANEAATYAGLEILDEPNFHTVAYFTEGGQQTVESYVAGTPLEGTVEAQPPDESLAQLEATRAEAIAAYEAQNIVADSDRDVTQNRVEMYVTAET